MKWNFSFKWKISKLLFFIVLTGFSQCLTVCDLTDCSPRGSSVHEILCPWKTLYPLSYLGSHLVCKEDISFYIYMYIYMFMGFLGGHSAKEPACQCRRHKRCVWSLGRKIPWSSAGHPLQYSCPENLMDREVWWAIVLRVTKSRAQLSNLLCMHTYVYVYYDSEKRHDEKWEKRASYISVLKNC